jgi:hypothetical protein
MGTRDRCSTSSSEQPRDATLPAAGIAGVTSAAGAEAEARSCSNSELPVLQHLRCYGFDDDAQDSWGLSWVCSYSSLTSLDLLFVSAGEVDFEAIAQLQQLRSLEIHCYPDELFTSSQLAPLASCSQLTCLQLDSLVIEPRHRAEAAAAESLGHGVTAAAAMAGADKFDAAAHVVQPQLLSLQKLVAGVLCKAPIAAFAPNLTQLRDVSDWALPADDCRV